LPNVTSVTKFCVNCLPVRWTIIVLSRPTFLVLLCVNERHSEISEISKTVLNGDILSSSD